MTTRTTLAPSRRGLLLGAAATLPFLAPRRPARAAALRVISSGGLNEAFKLLAPEFERRTGIAVHREEGSSMGAAPDAIPQRLARGEAFDVLLLAAGGFEALVQRGLAMPGSRVDLARSLIGMAVREGAPRPDISTVDRLRDVLLAARSIGYSASASGIYIENEMYRTLGVHEQVMPKSRRILSERVAAVVARGEVEIGFQQVSEIISIPGASFVGPIPEAVQRATVFSAGLTARPANPESGQRLIAFLASPEAAPALERTGLQPLVGR